MEKICNLKLLNVHRCLYKDFFFFFLVNPLAFLYRLLVLIDLEVTIGALLMFSLLSNFNLWPHFN